jgi:hypothetical protein
VDASADRVARNGFEPTLGAALFHNAHDLFDGRARSRQIFLFDDFIY